MLSEGSNNSVAANFLTDYFADNPLKLQLVVESSRPPKRIFMDSMRKPVSAKMTRVKTQHQSCCKTGYQRLVARH